MKTELCEEKNIHLFHIFSNEWINPKKRDIWKSKILIKLHSNKIKKLDARKCIIKEVNYKLSKEFLEEKPREEVEEKTEEKPKEKTEEKPEDSEKIELLIEDLKEETEEEILEEGEDNFTPFSRHVYLKQHIRKFLQIL